MARWTYIPEPGGDPGSPVFLRIARAISADIQTGRLKAGERLPGTRPLAGVLGVHRNTVIAAYDELAAQGWIETRPAGGTFVTREIPTGLNQVAAGETPAPPGLAHRIGAPDVPPGTLALASGMPDLRLVPVDMIARAYRRAMRVYGKQVLAYGDPRGHERLRSALAGMLAALRGLPIGPDDIQITRGSQMALDLVGRALLRPGDVVAVEALGYRPAWEALRMSGAALVPVPVDEQGIRTDDLALLAAAEPRLRAAYVTPHHQYPTTRVMAPGRRMALLDLARRHDLTLIEDDYDFEFHFEGKPVLPLASVASAAGFVGPARVVYIGTLSKILAPGLRLGFLVAGRALLGRIAAIRQLCDRQGDLALEAAVAGLVEDGELQRHAQRMRKEYRNRRDALAEALRATFGDALHFTVPSGGMALWVNVGDGLDPESWSAAAPDHGVMFSPPSRFAFEPPGPPCVRLGFAPLDQGELHEAVRRMAKAAPHAKAAPGG